GCDAHIDQRLAIRGSPSVVEHVDSQNVIRAERKVCDANRARIPDEGDDLREDSAVFLPDGDLHPGWVIARSERCIAAIVSLEYIVPARKQQAWYGTRGVAAAIQR